MTPDDGISDEEARRRLAANGPNDMPASQPQAIRRLMSDVVLEPMFLLLVACGAVYMALGDRGEALMLLTFVFVVMGLSFAQQRRTGRALAALRDLSSPRALVVRAGQARRVAGRELVCGDIVLLAEGDRVPADMRLVESSNLAVDESMLTGESAPVMKRAPVRRGRHAAPGPEAAALVFAGTLVTQGNARGEVVATGERSALGRIGKSLAGIERGGTPIQDETRRIVTVVASIALLLAGGLALAYGVMRGDWLRGLLAGLTLAMAVVPEELPLILTLFLGLGAWRLAQRNVLARSIPAVELLGAATVLCVDKTGTLTQNRMTVRTIWANAAVYDTARHAAAPLPEALHGVLEYAVLASHRHAFDPMEKAIGEAGRSLLAGTEHLHGDWTVVNDYPLSPEMLAMSRVWQSPDRRARVIAAKGAPEAIADLCHLDQRQWAAIAQQVAMLATEGWRVLGVARATFSADQLPRNQHDFKFGFLGLVALEDPVRPDVPAAIAHCHEAGMRVVMITGDHPATALSIARQAGLPVDAGAVTGAELDALDGAALAARLVATHVFCRVRPEQKVRLVQALQAAGEVVAMTGDGVNDAPALKAAHIGVAMGGRGTDVAREAAALVLLNDDFASLVTAVRYGRRVYANLRKAMVFVIAAHVPIIGLSLFPVLLGWPLVLMPVHILFLQLLIDPACSIVFEAEAADDAAMTARPRRPTARLFDAPLLMRGLWQGGGLLAALLSLYAAGRLLSGSDTMARTITFAALVVCNLALIQANRAWQPASRPGRRPFNWYFGGLALVAVVMLAGVLGVSGLARLFAFERPTPLLMLVAIGGIGVSLLWFKTVDWFMKRQ